MPVIVSKYVNSISNKQYTIYTYTVPDGSTTSFSTIFSAPYSGCEVQYLVVGGGGSGGSGLHSGGGGAGGVLTGSYTFVSKGDYLPVEVGIGGPAQLASVKVGSPGGNSKFGSYIALGGGGGGNSSVVAPSGASSGGSGCTTGYLTPSIPISTTPIQGYIGGSGIVTGNLTGGGGGAGGPGGVGVKSVTGSSPLLHRGGSGGVGISSDISGTTQWYAGGGGGGIGLACTTGYSCSGGLGGSGVGGNGAFGTTPTNLIPGSNGTLNTGSGGGGNGAAQSTTIPSYSGGSGIVIIRYLTKLPIIFKVVDSSGLPIINPTVTFDGVSYSATQSDSPGYVTVPYISVGSYKYLVSKNGYTSSNIMSIYIEIDIDYNNNSEVLLTSIPTITLVPNKVVFTVIGSEYSNKIPITGANLTIVKQNGVRVDYSFGNSNVYTLEKVEDDTYTYTIYKDWYTDISGEFTILGGINKNITEILLSTTGSVVFTSTSSFGTSSSIYPTVNIYHSSGKVTHDDLGSAGLKLIGLEPGIYTYDMSLINHFTSDKKYFTINPDTNTDTPTITLSGYGNVSFSMVPTGSLIEIKPLGGSGEDYIGTNSGSIDLVNGTYEYTVSNKGYVSKSGQFVLSNPGDTYFISEILEESLGNIEFKTNVDGAILNIKSIDLEPVVNIYRTTPCNILGIRTGVYTYNFVLDGYQKFQEKTIIIQFGDNGTRFEELLPCACIKNQSYGCNGTETLSVCKGDCSGYDIFKNSVECVGSVEFNITPTNCKFTFGGALQLFPINIYDNIERYQIDYLIPGSYEYSVEKLGYIKQTGSVLIKSGTSGSNTVQNIRMVECNCNEYILYCEDGARRLCNSDCTWGNYEMESSKCGSNLNFEVFPTGSVTVIKDISGNSIYSHIGNFNKFFKSGNYTYTSSYANFISKTRSFTIYPGENKTINETLNLCAPGEEYECTFGKLRVCNSVGSGYDYITSSKCTGGVRFVTNVGGARLTFDGTVIGNTPIDVVDIPPGGHRYKLEYVEYKSFEGEIIVSPGSYVTLDMISLEPCDCYHDVTYCDGNTKKTCKSDCSWGDLVYNSSDCVKGSSTQLCNPGEYSCIGINKTTYRVCNHDGNGWIDTPKSSECGYICNPGETNCFGKSLKMCNNQGTSWEVVGECPATSSESFGLSSNIVPIAAAVIGASALILSQMIRRK